MTDLTPIPTSELARLREMFERIAAYAPTEEPEIYDGDNHGDSYNCGYDRARYYDAQIARAALAWFDAQKEVK